jgi:vesicle coat complex subunit
VGLPALLQLIDTLSHCCVVGLYHSLTMRLSPWFFDSLVVHSLTPASFDDYTINVVSVTVLGSLSLQRCGLSHQILCSAENGVCHARFRLQMSVQQQQAILLAVEGPTVQSISVVRHPKNKNYLDGHFLNRMDLSR